jgi:hypothetical protein
VATAPAGLRRGPATRVRHDKAERAAAVGAQKASRWGRCSEPAPARGHVVGNPSLYSPLQIVRT